MPGSGCATVAGMPSDPCLHAPLRDLAGAHAAIAAVLNHAAARGTTVKPAPPEPVGCCGRGCEGCVWLGWFEALERWRNNALLACAPEKTLPGLDIE
jgi:hypothetical protein